MDSIYTVTTFSIVEQSWVIGQLVLVSPLEVLGPTACLIAVLLELPGHIWHNIKH